MERNDIYEHLAKIYLDASVKKKSKKFSRHLKKFVTVGIFLIFGAGVFFFSDHKKESNFPSEVAFILAYEPLKINFHFDPAKKEIYTIQLNNLDLSKFKSLVFSAKKANYPGAITLRLEFTNTFNENASKYIREIPYRWQEYGIELSSLEGVRDWSSVKSLSFIVEEWNAQEKQGVVYIDNVRLLKS